MSDKYNLEVEKDNDFDLSLTYKSGGVAVNLTGYTYVWYVEVGDVVHTYTTTPQITVTTPSTGVILLHLSAAETILFTVKRGKHYFKVISPTGGKKTLLKGVVDVDD